MSETNNDKPWIENYPPLRAWLDRHNARCLSQTKDGDGFLERWLIGTRICLIEVRPRNMGWNIYTDSDSPTIVATIRDAETRLGLTVPASEVA